MLDEQTNDFVVCALLEAIWQDRSNGMERDLSHYCRLFPGYEAVVEAEWGRLCATDPEEISWCESELESSFPPGSLVGPYRVEAVLGQGGQGLVLKVWDPTLDRVGAIKVLRSPFLTSPAAKSRFAREGQLAARLDHPSICRVYGTGFHGPSPYLVMALVEGSTLGQHLAKWSSAGGPPLERRMGWVEAILDGVAHAHSKEVIHRDLKPSNIVVTPADQPVILDFGLARGLESEVALTGSQEGFGTAGYMAPEQWDTRLGPPGKPADVFALGILIHEVVTGERPIPGRRMEDYVRALLSDNKVQLSSTLPRGLRAIVEKCLVRDPSGRYPDATALLADVRAYLRGGAVAAESGRRVRQVKAFAHRRRWVLFTLGLASVAVGATWLRMSQDSSDSLPLFLGPEWSAALAAGRDVEALLPQAKQGAEAGFGSGMLIHALAAEAESRRIPEGITGDAEVAQGERLPDVVQLLGRPGEEVIVPMAGSGQRRVPYPGCRVEAARVSLDRRRLGVVAWDDESARRRLDVWSVADGARLWGCDLPVESRAACLAPDLHTESWFVGYRSGEVAWCNPGRGTVQRSLMESSVQGLLPVGARGVLAWGAGGERRWFATDVVLGARRLPLGIPIGALAFEPDGTLRMDAAAVRWSVTWDPQSGRLVQWSPRPPRAAQVSLGGRTEEEVSSERASASKWIPTQTDERGRAMLSDGTAWVLQDDRWTWWQPGSVGPSVWLSGFLGARCCAVDEERQRVAVATSHGEVLVWERPGPGKVTVPEWEMPPNDVWDAFDTHGFVPRPSPGASSVTLGWMRLWAACEAPDSHRAAYGLPSFPRWMGWVKEVCDDRLAADPADGSIALARALVGWHLGLTDQVIPWLDQPPLAGIADPTTSLLRALAVWETDPTEALRLRESAAEHVARMGIVPVGYRWLRYEVESTFAADPSEAWSHLAESWEQVGRGVLSWADVVERLPTSAGNEVLLSDAREAANTVARYGGSFLAGRRTDLGVQEEAIALVRLAAAVADAADREALAVPRARAWLRDPSRGEPPEAWLDHLLAEASRQQDSGAVATLALVHLRRGDATAAEGAYNQALVLSAREPTRSPEVAVLLREVEEGLPSFP